MSAHKTLHDEAQACELNTRTGQGRECVSAKLFHVAGKDHNTKLPPGAPNEWFQVKTTSWLQQLSSSSETQPAAQKPCDSAMWMCNVNTTAREQKVGPNASFRLAAGDSTAL